MNAYKTCVWCLGSEDDNVDSETLCKYHEAEFEGLSVDGLDHRDSEWEAELADMRN